jgi:hypothetical protein
MKKYLSPENVEGACIFAIGLLAWVCTVLLLAGIAVAVAT